MIKSCVDAYRKEALGIARENEMRDYQHKMRLAGTTRLTLDQVKHLVSVHEGQPVANSMIVFGKGGTIYNLPLRPYFTKTENKINQKEENLINQNTNKEESGSSADNWIAAFIFFTLAGLIIKFFQWLF